MAFLRILTLIDPLPQMMKTVPDTLIALMSTRRLYKGYASWILALSLMFALGSCEKSDVRPPSKSDRERAGLIGKVKEVVATDVLFFTTERYDRDGRLLEIIRDLRDKKPTTEPIHYVYVYDSQGRRIAERSGRSKATPPDLVRYFYDTAGNRIAELALNSDGTVGPHKTFYLYDTDGQLRGRVAEVSTRTVIVEDIDKGHPVKNTLFENERIVSEVRLSYNRDDRLQESRFYQSDGALGQKQSHEYDAQGNVSRETVYAADGTLLGQTAWIYVYDAKGNWTKKTGSEKRAGPSERTSESTEERKITYYD